ncbi:hypothetical protein EJA70_15405 [Pseudomonas sp. PB103]|uniref:hypothetical protein n=1 Tax=Pseudomonas sp. PB103 TaxID=2494698 RepID=UPI00131AF1E3|nr:hypothetical protein [Pseudomonas sp. PB103]KAE9643824.1 hypothetical protein EJA70_15405 [Pseudomonas sp. PB103]
MTSDSGKKRPIIPCPDIPPVGAAEGCDLLTLFFKRQDQKIAAFGSSYIEENFICREQDLSPIQRPFFKLRSYSRQA